MMHNLLIYRLILLNVAAFAILAVAAMKGYVGLVVTGGQSTLIYGMAALFMIGLASVFRRAAKVSAGLNAIHEGRTPKVEAAKFTAKSAHIDEIAIFLVTLSLLGNVIGFAIGVSGPHDLNSSQGLLAFAGRFIDGMTFAFMTTIAGIALALWLSLNALVLRTATALFLADAAKADSG